MIPVEIARTAIDLAQEFDRRGLRLNSRADAPLQTLVSASTLEFKDARGVVITEAERNAAYEPTPESIHQETTFPSAQDATRSVHDFEMESMIDELSGAVSQHLSFAKNTVSPLVKEYAAKVTAALAAYPESASYTPDVQRWDIPAPMLNPSFEDSVREYKDTPYVPLVKHMSLPCMDTEQLLQAIKTGSSSADDEITAWLTTKDSEFVSGAYHAVFTNENVGSFGASFETIVTDESNGVDAALVVYLLAKRLIDNPPEGTTSSLAAYRTEMGEYLQQAGLRLSQAYDKRELDLKTELLILSKNEHQVRVFAPVYDNWLANGGNNAILFGNLLSDRPALFLPGMVDKAQEFLANWERQNRFLTATMQNKRFTEAKKTLIFQAEQLMHENLQAIYGEFASTTELSFTTTEVAKAAQLVQEYVETLREEAIGDIWEVASRVVAERIFYYTDAYCILTGINDACKQNPNIDVNEAALLSTIEYVCEYVCDQLVVSDI